MIYQRSFLFSLKLIKIDKKINGQPSDNSNYFIERLSVLLSNFYLYKKRPHLLRYGLNDLLI
nr:MAG TPA_asm: hypothetical protein [Caudoviricetes sp.]